MRRPVDDRSSDPSGTFVTDGDFSAFDDHGHVPFAAGMLEHLLQLGTIRLDVEIGCFVAKG